METDQAKQWRKEAGKRNPRHEMSGALPSDVPPTEAGYRSNTTQLALHRDVMERGRDPVSDELLQLGEGVEVWNHRFRVHGGLYQKKPFLDDLDRTAERLIVLAERWGRKSRAETIQLHRNAGEGLKDEDMNPYPTIPLSPERKQQINEFGNYLANIHSTIIEMLVHGPAPEIIGHATTEVLMARLKDASDNEMWKLEIKLEPDEDDALVANLRDAFHARIDKEETGKKTPDKGKRKA